MLAHPLIPLLTPCPFSREHPAGQRELWRRNPLPGQVPEGAMGPQLPLALCSAALVPAVPASPGYPPASRHPARCVGARRPTTAAGPPGRCQARALGSQRLRVPPPELTSSRDGRPALPRVVPGSRPGGMRLWRGMLLIVANEKREE